MQKILPYLKLCLISVTFLFSCKGEDVKDDDKEPSGATPVTLTTIAKETLQETVELNATSSFQLKTNVKANTNGYLQNLKVKLGDYVSKGEVIFVLKTKEAESLGNTIDKIDTSFHFKGLISIKAPGSGYVTELDHQSGDYVQEGDQVLLISDASSFVFLLNLPYELTRFLPSNNSLELKLPDSTVLKGTIIKAMPSADAASQTQSYAIHVQSDKMIPENLIAKVKLIKKNKKDAVSLPKEAILTNEVQSEFWIMKMINDSIAVKLTITKGLETQQRVEILSPLLTENDKILLTGNYGLPDTALVKVHK